jgi:hypothetical protein
MLTRETPRRFAVACDINYRQYFAHSVLIIGSLLAQRMFIFRWARSVFTAAGRAFAPENGDGRAIAAISIR